MMRREKVAMRTSTLAWETVRGWRWPHTGNIMSENFWNRRYNFHSTSSFYSVPHSHHNQDRLYSFGATIYIASLSGSLQPRSQASLETRLGIEKSPDIYL